MPRVEFEPTIPAFEDSSYLRPRGHCDRRFNYQQNYLPIKANDSKIVTNPSCWTRSGVSPYLIYLSIEMIVFSPEYLWMTGSGRRWPLAWRRLPPPRYAPGARQGAAAAPLYPLSSGWSWCPQSAYSDGLPLCSLTERRDDNGLQR
jgi:hypothetical protein